MTSQSMKDPHEPSEDGAVLTPLCFLGIWQTAVGRIRCAELCPVVLGKGESFLSHFSTGSTASMAKS